MSMLDDLAGHLETQGVGTVWAGADDGSTYYVFKGILPDTPHRVICLIEGAGRPPEHTMGGETEPVLERPNLQAVVRGDAWDYTGPRTAVDLVWRELGKLAGSVIGGARYTRVEAIDSIHPLERDESDRVMFSANFRVLKELD